MKERKKIGIITILNVNNYGAELQASALCQKLNLLGYDTEIINFFYYKTPGYKFELKSRSLFPLPLKNLGKEILLLLRESLVKFLNPSYSKRRKKAFDDFHKQYSRLSSPIESVSKLYATKFDYDVFIVGSDQVWNPNNPINLEPYFLKFAPKNKLKMSYASSFGVENIDDTKYEVYKGLLNNLDILSCREASGVNIIQKISGRTATHVVDPTLLLTKAEWETKMKPFDFKEPYILLFVFKESSFIDAKVKEIQQRLGYKVVRICKDEQEVANDGDFINLRDLGPSEFLGVYQKASFVITSSFHGTVFSLIFEKPFITITPSSKNNNTRQKGLLDLVGLKNCLVSETDTLDESIYEEFDYGRIREVISQERAKSIDYINQSVNQSSNK